MKKTFILFALCIVCNHLFANLSQGNWRWRSNNGNETTATWKAAENTAIVITDTSTIRLRIEISNITGGAKDFSQSLQYATNTNGPWETVNSVSSSFVLAGSSLFVTQGQATTKQLMGNSNNSFVSGQIIVSNEQFLQSLPDATKTEYEWLIKPAQSIEKNTTYYFRTSVNDYPVVLPSLTTASNFPALPKLIKNGGFENDLTSWKTVLGNGSATFTTAPGIYHTGNKAVKVAVTNAGGTNKLLLRSKAVTLNTSDTYELRFWAIADTRDALLNINIRGASTNNICSYKIYDRFDEAQNGWQMYHYTFKVTESTVTLNIAFNTNTTYYIDDIEILPSADPVIDVKTQYNWQYNQQGYGWLSGDNDNSVLLPDSSVAWIFSDSYLGNPDAHSNIISNNTIINNLIVHEQNDQYTSVFGGTSSSPQSLFSPGNGNVFWNSGGVVDGNKLKVLLIEIGNGTYQQKTYIGTLSLPGLQVQGQVESSYHGANSPNTMFQDGTYNYIYLSEHVGTFENYSQVARVPVGSLNATTEWEFYKNDNTWSTGYTNVKRIISGVEAGSVRKLGTGNYVMSAVPNLSSELAVWFAPAPEGPWTNKHVVYNIPQEEGVLAYDGHIDAGSGANGVYTLSFSVYPFSGLVPEQLSDKGSYIPYYAKANLLALSPYTNKIQKSNSASIETNISLKKDTLQQAFVFPNPTSNNIRFVLNGFKEKTMQATLTDISGKMLYQEKINVTTNAVYTLKNTRPPAGVYVLTLTGTSFQQSMKVIIQ